jgi:hypothetical protein
VFPPYNRFAGRDMLARMPRFMLTHRHGAEECRVAFASWRGFESPLRHAGTFGSCLLVNGTAEHEIWWTVDAPDRDAALAQVPAYVAERTEATEITEVSIP